MERTAPDAELILVDNASTDITAMASVTIRNAENQGFARACNQGASRAAGDIVVFLNNDTVPQPGWFAALLDPFTDPAVAITGARLVYPDGRLQHAGVWFDRPGGILTAHNELTEQPTRDVDAVTGACLAIRATAFRELGGFDESYWNGYEDVDLCLQARAAGWSIRYVAESTVVHHESASGPERWTGVRQNIARLQDRWGATYGNHLVYQPQGASLDQ